VARTPLANAAAGFVEPGVASHETDDASPAADTVESLRTRLVEEIDRRRDRDRELVEQRARADAAEAELGNVRLTLAFGLGHALVEALHWRGFLRLPGRVLELRRRQAAKRGRLPGRYKGVRPSDAMHLVDAAIAQARSGGASAARASVTAAKATSAEKARALVEAALALVPIDAEGALALGLDAAALKGGEPRLFSLALALHAEGGLSGPLALLDKAGDQLPRSTAMDTAIAAIRGEADAPIPDIPARAQIASPGDGCLIAVAARSRADRDLDGLRAEACGAPVIDLAAVAHEVPGGAGVLHVVGLHAPEVPAAIATAHERGMTVILDVLTLPSWALAGDETERSRRAEARVAATLRAADRLVVRSEATRVAIARLAPGVATDLIAADPIVTARVAEPDLLDLRRELDVRPDRPVIVCPVPLEADPGLFDLVESLTALAADLPETTLLFTNTGAAAPALARAAARRGVARNVLFAGSTVPADLPAQLSLARVVALPRRGAAVGADLSPAFATARAIGIPVVASEVERRWRGDGGEGVFLADDVGALVAALRCAFRATASTSPVAVGRESEAMAALHGAVQQKSAATVP
jgi:hypothetical protein